MKTIKLPDGKPMKIWADDLDPLAANQIANLSKMRFIHKHISIMPDAHLGIGCTIGTVLPTKRFYV